MSKGQVAVIFPQGICGNVGDDHWLTSIGSGSTRACFRPYRLAINGLEVGFRQARCCPVAHMDSIGIEKKYGGKHARTLRLDDTQQRIQYDREGLPLSD